MSTLGTKLKGPGNNAAREAARRWGGLGTGDARYERLCPTLEYAVGFVHYPGGVETFVECGRGGSWAGAFENADQREAMLSPEERRERTIVAAKKNLARAKLDEHNFAIQIRPRTMNRWRRAKARVEAAEAALAAAMSAARAIGQKTC